MKFYLKYIALFIIILKTQINCTQKKEVYTIDASRIVSHTVDLKTQDLQFFYADSLGNRFANFKNLSIALQQKQKELVFAMNGGMYTKTGNPQGLYIEQGIQKAPINRKKEGYGNFYLQPNGIFYITTSNIAKIETTSTYRNRKDIKFATQSGPMLVINDSIHPKLTKGSKNLHIRNGVGILPNGSLLFAMSKEKINFYDFATFFKQNGCKNALYLDGFVSRMYLPSKNWEQFDGNFGVIIAEIESKKVTLNTLKSKVTMKQPKQKDTTTEKGTVIISAPIQVSNASGTSDEKEFYIQRSIQNYFIKFSESAITKEELSIYLAKKGGIIPTVTLEIEYRDGFLDDDEKQKSNPRKGQYVIVHKIVN